jgi:CRISPR-associated protein (TIGR02584 family)
MLRAALTRAASIVPSKRFFVVSNNGFGYNIKMKNKTKNILICVAGATPQVITETIYALSKKSPPVYINELFVITTSYGKQLIEKRLIQEGILNSLIKEYDLPEISFSEQSILVIKDIEGNELEDIRNNKDNEATADLITTFIKQMTEQQDTALHCSIAGGRKTMSYYLGSALQLFGRPQDRLYHVLVSSEFENNPEFFYPPKRHRKVTCRMLDGTIKSISTAKAEIHLADLPFVRLKDRVWLEKKTFKELIGEAEESMRLSISHLPIMFQLKKGQIIVGDTKIQLPPMLLSFYALFAEEKTTRCRSTERTNCFNCNECYLTVADLAGTQMLNRIKKFNALIYGENSSRLEDSRWYKYKDAGGISPDIIRQYISKTNRVLQKNLRNSELYLIERIRRYGATTYGIRVDKSRIKFV